MKRRSFLAALAAAAGSVIASTNSVWAATKKPKVPANAIGKVTAFKVRKPVTVVAKFNGATRNVIVNRYAANKYLVLDTVCTHQGCQVAIDGALAKCPCHRAEFDLATGTNSRPPDGSTEVAPLKTYATVVKNGYLIFTN